MKELYSDHQDATTFSGTESNNISDAVRTANLSLGSKEQQDILKEIFAGLVEGVTGLPMLTVSDSNTETETAQRFFPREPEYEPTPRTNFAADFEIKYLAGKVKENGTFGDFYDRKQTEAIFDQALKAGPEAVEALIDAINKELEGSGYEISGNVITEKKMVQNTHGGKLIPPESASADVSHINLFLTKDKSKVEDMLDVDDQIHPPYDGPEWRIRNGVNDQPWNIKY